MSDLPAHTHTHIYAPHLCLQRPERLLGLPDVVLQRVLSHHMDSEPGSSTRAATALNHYISPAPEKQLLKDYVFL